MNNSKIYTVMKYHFDFEWCFSQGSAQLNQGNGMRLVQELSFYDL